MKRTIGNVDGRNGKKACIAEENNQQMTNKKYISTTLPHGVHEIF